MTAPRMVPLSPLSHDEAAVHRDGLTGHIARSFTAKPQNSVRDLFRSANASHRYALLHCPEGFALTHRDHLVGHRCPNEARTYGIDTNAACRIFESRALGRPKDSLFLAVISCSLGTAHKSSQRRAINDGATSLLAYLLQLKLHATPYTAQIDRHHPVVVVSGRISSLCEGILNAGIVVAASSCPKVVTV